MKRDKRITFYVDSELFELVDQFAKMVGVSRSELLFQFFDGARPKFQAVREVVAEVFRMVESGEAEEKDLSVEELNQMIEKAVIEVVRGDALPPYSNTGVREWEK